MGKKVIGSNLLYATTIRTSAAARVGSKDIGIQAPTGNDLLPSVSYRSVVGDHLVLSLTALKDFATLENVHGARRESRASLVSDPAAVEAETSSVIRYVPSASHPGSASEDPGYLFFVEATLSPAASLGGGKEILEELARPHALGLFDYVYTSQIGAPTWYWFAGIDIANLEALGDPVAVVKEKAGSVLLDSFAPLFTNITSDILRKI